MGRPVEIRGHGRAARELAKALVYGIHQGGWSAWARWRYRDDFRRVERFCLFVGYPRSGHSIVGAMLNAHRDAVISHELVVPPLVLAGCSREELYSRILARAAWFDWRGNRSKYSYQVPSQWQGRFRELRVIGDKRGGAVARCLTEHPDFLQRVRELVCVPLRLVHVVRNPFDNIAAISLDNGLRLETSVDYYFSHCAATARLDELAEPAEHITVHHEEMISDPTGRLSSLCAFLGLETYDRYLEDCSSIVFKRPTYTRRRVSWTRGLVRDVERRAEAYSFLNSYSFDVPEVR